MERQNFPEYTSKVESDQQDLLHLLRANVALSIKAAGLSPSEAVAEDFSGVEQPTFQLRDKGIELPDAPEISGQYRPGLTKAYLEAAYDMSFLRGALCQTSLRKIRLVTNEFAVNADDEVMVVSREYGVGDNMEMHYGIGVTALGRENKATCTRAVQPGSYGEVLADGDTAPRTIFYPLPSGDEVFGEERMENQFINAADQSLWAASGEEGAMPIQEKQQLLSEMNLIIEQMV